MNVKTDIQAILEGRKIDVRYSLASSACLLAAGLAGGYLLGRALANRKADQRIAQEVESVKQYYRERGGPAVSHPDSEDGGGDGDQRSAPAMGEEGVAGTVPGHGRAVPAASPHHRNYQDPRRADADPDWKDPLAGMPGHDADTGDDDEIDGIDDEEVPRGDSSDPSAGIEIPESIDPTRPYIITYEQMFEGDPDETYRKITVTYYAGDKVLVDDHDVPIQDVMATAGSDFAEQFGKDSRDPHIVYVRNEQLQVDFEIVHHEGSYVDEILNYGRPGPRE